MQESSEAEKITVLEKHWDYQARLNGPRQNNVSNNWKIYMLQSATFTKIDQVLDHECLSQ